MKLNVQTFAGHHFEIGVQPTYTVMAVKKIIEDVFDNYPCGQQRLLHNWKELKDETTLAENEVTENGFLFLIIVSKNKTSGSVGTSSTQPAQAPTSKGTTSAFETARAIIAVSPSNSILGETVSKVYSLSTNLEDMKLHVQTIAGHHFEIRVQPTDTVMAVKKNIEDVFDNYPCEQQRLLHNWKELKDETTLAESEVTENGFLLLIIVSKPAEATPPTTAPTSNSPPAVEVQAPTSKSTTSASETARATEEEHQMELENFSDSDAKYAFQFQKAVMGSIIIPQMKNKTLSSTLMEKPLPDPANRIEPSESSLRFCEICVEGKEIKQMFDNERCVHSFCCDCINKYVASNIGNSISVVTCPGLNCRALLELEICRPQLSKGVIDIWEEALCKELISGSKFYCPFKDCSALMVNDNGGQAIRESECPFCHRLFCAQCNVPWHSGIDCEEFQRLNEDERGREDLMVMELAKNQKWSRCPKCKIYVERTEGCPHMTCRCNFEFCYGCGSQWTPSHGGCQRN